MATPDTPHPTGLLIPQWRAEEILRERLADYVKPYLIGASGLVDDGGHASRAYGEDVLVLVRPDGYVGLLAGADDTQTLSDYLHSLMAFQAVGPARPCLPPGAAASAYPSATHDQQHQASHGHDRSDHRPHALAAHRTSAQYVKALQCPDPAGQHEQYADDD